MTLRGKFDTERMSVQHWADDLDNGPRQRQLAREISELLTPAVLRHLPEPLHVADSADAIDQWITERVSESDVMTVRGAGNSRLLGLLILADPSEPGKSATIHLGYLFAETTWGQGFATELIAGLVRWIKKTGRSTQLIGGVEPGNVASARVLQKNGFEKLDALSGPETEMFGLSI